MNSALNKIFASEIDNQWLKVMKDLVMGYNNKMLVEMIDWLYIIYGNITPG